MYLIGLGITVSGVGWWLVNAFMNVDMTAQRLVLEFPEIVITIGAGIIIQLLSYAALKRG
jgi:hypothetical protein